MDMNPSSPFFRSTAKAAVSKPSLLSYIWARGRRSSGGGRSVGGGNIGGWKW